MRRPLGRHSFCKLQFACTHYRFCSSRRVNKHQPPLPPDGKVCAAGAVQGRRWPEVRTHLADMWGMALRCADDIKESVRGAAAGALRALRGLTLRLCDPAATPAADAGEAVALALPLLLDQGAREFAASHLLPLRLALAAGCLCGS